MVSKLEGRTEDWEEDWEEGLGGQVSGRRTGPFFEKSMAYLGFLRRARPGITSGVAGVNQKSHQVNGICLETVAGTQS